MERMGNTDALEAKAHTSYRMTDAELLRAVIRERDPVNYVSEIWFRYEPPDDEFTEYEIKRMPRR